MTPSRANKTNDPEKNRLRPTADRLEHVERVPQLATPPPHVERVPPPRASPSGKSEKNPQKWHFLTVPRAEWSGSSGPENPLNSPRSNWSQVYQCYTWNTSPR